MEYRKKINNIKAYRELILTDSILVNGKFTLKDLNFKYIFSFFLYMLLSTMESRGKKG